MERTRCWRAINLCLLFIILVRASKQDSSTEKNNSESLKHDHDCDKLEGSDEGTYETFSEDEIKNNERTNYKKAIKSVLCWTKLTTATYNVFGHKLNQTVKYGLSVETSEVFVGEHIVFPDYIRRNLARESKHPVVVKQIHGQMITEERQVTCKHKYKILGDGSKTGTQKVEVWIRPEHSNEVILNPLETSSANVNCSQDDANKEFGVNNAVSTTPASTTIASKVTASSESEETESCDDDITTELPKLVPGQPRPAVQNPFKHNLFPVAIVKIAPPAQTDIKCEFASKHVVAVMCPDSPHKLPVIDESRLPSDVKLTFSAIIPKSRSRYDILVKGKQSCYILHRHSEIICPKSTKKMFTIYILRRRVTTPALSISDSTATPPRTTTLSRNPPGSTESQETDSTGMTPTVSTESTTAPTTPASKLFTAKIIDFVRKELPVCYFVDGQILRGPCQENYPHVLHLLSLKLPEYIEAVGVISPPEYLDQYLYVRMHSFCYYLKKVELINCINASPDLINLMKMPEISDATTTMAPDDETKSVGERSNTESLTTTTAPNTVFKSRPVVQLIDHHNNKTKSSCRNVDSHVHIINCPKKLDMYRVDETTIPENIDMSYLEHVPDTTTKKYIFVKGALDCYLFQIIKNVDCNIMTHMIVFHRDLQPSTPSITEPTEEPQTQPFTEKTVEISTGTPKVTEALTTTRTTTAESEELDDSQEMSLRMISMIEVDAKGSPRLACQYVSPYVISVRCPEQAPNMYNFLKYSVPPGFFIVTKKSYPFLLSHRYVSVRGLHSCYLFRKIQDVDCPTNIKSTLTLYKHDPDSKTTTKPSIKDLINFVTNRSKAKGNDESFSTTQQYATPTWTDDTTQIYKTTATLEPENPGESENTRTTRSVVTLSDDETLLDSKITESVLLDLNEPIPTSDLNQNDTEKLPENRTFIVKLIDIELDRPPATQCKRVHRYVLTLPCPKDKKNFYYILDALPTVANQVKTKIIPKRLLHRALFARHKLSCHVFISLGRVKCSKHEKDAVKLIKTPLEGIDSVLQSSDELEHLVIASTVATTSIKPEPASTTLSFSKPTRTWHFKQTTPTTTFGLSKESTVHITNPTVAEFSVVTLGDTTTDSSREENLSDSKPVVTYNPEHTITVRLIKINSEGHRKERCKITKKYIMSLTCPRHTDKAYLLQEHEAPRKVKFIRLQVFPEHLTKNFIFAKGLLKCYLIEKLADIPCPKSMKDTFNLVKFKTMKYVEDENKAVFDVLSTQPPLPTKSLVTILFGNQISSTHEPSDLPASEEAVLTPTAGQPAANSSESGSSEEYYEGFRIRLIEIGGLKNVRIRCKLVFNEVIKAKCPPDTRNFYYVNETQVLRFAQLNNFRHFPKALTHVRSVALAKGNSGCYVFKALHNIKCPLSVDNVLNLFKVQDRDALATLVNIKSTFNTELKEPTDTDSELGWPYLILGNNLISSMVNKTTTSITIPPTFDYSNIKLPEADTFVVRLIDPLKDENNSTCKVVYKNVIKTKCPKRTPNIYHIRKFNLPERVNVILRKNVSKLLKLGVILARGKRSCYVFMDLGGTQCSQWENTQNLYKPVVEASREFIPLKKGPQPQDENLEQDYDSVIRIDGTKVSRMPQKHNATISEKKMVQFTSTIGTMAPDIHIGTHLEHIEGTTDALTPHGSVTVSTTTPLQVFTEYSAAVPVTASRDLAACEDISIVKIIDLHNLGRTRPVFKTVKKTVHSVSCSTIKRGQYLVNELELRKKMVVISEPATKHRASGKWFYAKSLDECYAFEELPSTKCPVFPYNLITLYKTFTWTYKRLKKMKITRLPNYVAYESLTKQPVSSQPSSRPVVARLVDIQPQQDVTVMCVTMSLNVLVIKCPEDTMDFYGVEDSQMAEKTHLFYLKKTSKVILSRNLMIVKGQEQCYFLRKIEKDDCSKYDEENLINMYRFGYIHSINLPHKFSLEDINKVGFTPPEESTTQRPSYKVVLHTTSGSTFIPSDITENKEHNIPMTTSNIFETKAHDLMMGEFITTNSPGFGFSSTTPAQPDASSEESRFDESIESLWKDDETSAEAQKPMIVKHKSRGRVFCYIIDASIKIKRINCPPDTSKIPRIVNPRLIKMICRRKIQNYHNNLHRRGLLMKYNLLKYDEES